MSKNRIVTLTINVDVWVGIDEDVDVPREVQEIMERLNHHDLEEYGGCRLLTYSTADIDDEENHNCMTMYDVVDKANGRGGQT